MAESMFNVGSLASHKRLVDCLHRICPQIYLDLIMQMCYVCLEIYVALYSALCSHQFVIA